MLGYLVILQMCIINNNHMLYGSWDMGHDGQKSVIFNHLLPFNPTNNPQKQNFKKMKVMPRDIFILHMCTITDNHGMVPEMYDSWDNRVQQIEFFVILDHFFLFWPPLTAQKIKILKKWKKMPWNIMILHKWTKNYDHMLYCSWDTVCDRCNFHFPLGAIFCPFTP